MMLSTVALLLSLSSPDVLLLANPPVASDSSLVASGDGKDDKDKSTSGKAKADKGKSSKAKPAGPDQGVGKKVLHFKAKDMAGKDIDFPGDYRGKVVLLDFWATWCGPCMAEMPNVASVYNQYHDRGLEVLGVTLDNKDAVEKIRKAEEEKGMKWPQIYDGGGWKADLAQKFGVTGIPRAILVDGDTGKIIAEGNALRGEGLTRAVEPAIAKLEKKHGKGSDRQKSSQKSSSKSSSSSSDEEKSRDSGTSKGSGSSSNSGSSSGSNSGPKP